MTDHIFVREGGELIDKDGLYLNKPRGKQRRHITIRFTTEDKIHHFHIAIQPRCINSLADISYEHDSREINENDLR